MKIDQLFRADIQQLFLDWGDSAHILERTRRYDVESGRLVDARYSIPVTVVPLEEKPVRVDGMAAGLSLLQRKFLVREQEIPHGVELISSQLMLNGLAFEIRSWSQSEHAGIVTLDCVGPGPAEKEAAHVH